MGLNHLISHPIARERVLMASAVERVARRACRVHATANRLTPCSAKTAVCVCARARACVRAGVHVSAISQRKPRKRDKNGQRASVCLYTSLIDCFWPVAGACINLGATQAETTTMRCPATLVRMDAAALSQHNMLMPNSCFGLPIIALAAKAQGHREWAQLESANAANPCRNMHESFVWYILHVPHKRRAE